MITNILASVYQWMRTYGATVLITVAVVFVFRWQVAEPFYIPSLSMEPTLTRGDRIIVSKLSVRPDRWDVVVFRDPEDPSRNFIKRVVGLPGEELMIKDGEIFINGEVVPKPPNIEGVFYTTSGSYGVYEPVKIPDDSYFMLGDNSPFSKDSRSWMAIHGDSIIGRAVTIIWPMERCQMIR